MSYSFGVTVPTKAAAKEEIVRKMDAVVGQQPAHEADAKQVLANANAAIDLLQDDPARDVSVSMSGYVSGTWDGNELVKLSGVSISVTASLATRPV